MKLARNERGFTLIELMVVLIIIGILAAIAIPIMSKQTDKAKNKRALSEIKGMKSAIDIWVNDSTVNTAGLKAPKAAAGTASDAINGVLKDAGIDTAIADPWGSKYYYSASATGVASAVYNYKIFSVGSDKAAGGSNDIMATSATVPQEGQNAASGDPPTDTDSRTVVTLEP